MIKQLFITLKALIVLVRIEKLFFFKTLMVMLIPLFFIFCFIYLASSDHPGAGKGIMFLSGLMLFGICVLEPIIGKQQ